MKALLIVIVLYVGEATTSLVTPMPTMSGCLAAAHQLESNPRFTSGLGNKIVMATCVENR